MEDSKVSLILGVVGAITGGISLSVNIFSFITGLLKDKKKVIISHQVVFSFGQDEKQSNAINMKTILEVEVANPSKRPLTIVDIGYSIGKTDFTLSNLSWLDFKEQELNEEKRAKFHFIMGDVTVHEKNIRTNKSTSTFNKLNEITELWVRTAGGQYFRKKIRISQEASSPKPAE